IPNRYFDYVRSGNAERLEPVVEHNRLDLLSLARMTARALQLLEDAPARCVSARESLAAGRILEGVGRLGDAECCYLDAIDRSRSERGSDTGSLRAEAMRHLALRYRRDARFPAAAEWWRGGGKWGGGRGGAGGPGRGWRAGPSTRWRFTSSTAPAICSRRTISRGCRW